jgi:asparagine synthase (glutamine-hydrolysing)
MEDRLPHDILYRPKMGFVTPISDWFKGPLADVALNVTTNSRLAQSGWFDPAALARVHQDHVSGMADHGRLLWQLVMLDKSMMRLFG